MEYLREKNVHINVLGYDRSGFRACNLLIGDLKRAPPRSQGFLARGTALVAIELSARNNFFRRNDILMLLKRSPGAGVKGSRAALLGMAHGVVDGVTKFPLP